MTTKSDAPTEFSVPATLEQHPLLEIPDETWKAIEALTNNTAQIATWLKEQTA